jgi:hypothetical protein
MPDTKRTVASLGNTWTHPRTGEVRVYLDPEEFGLEIWKYGTGNVSHAWVNGEKIANGRAAKILAAKFWVGGDGRVRTNCDQTAADPIIEAMVAAVAEAAEDEQQEQE